MHRSLFLAIAEVVEKHDDWFKLRSTVSGKITATPLKKCTMVI
jgi:hypothetical protein